MSPLLSQAGTNNMSYIVVALADFCGNNVQYCESNRYRMLKMQKDDKLTVQAETVGGIQYNPQWLYGLNQSTNEQGWFPSTYVSPFSR